MGSDVRFTSLDELSAGASYVFESPDSDISGSFRVLSAGANPTVLLCVEQANGKAGFVPLGVSTVVLIGWSLDADNYMKSLCLSPFSGDKRFDFGNCCLLGLALHGADPLPRPVMLGVNPQITSIVESPPRGFRRD